MKCLPLALFMFVGVVNAQLSVSSIQPLPVPAVEHWSNAIFSANGHSIFMTNTEFNGIWEYSLVNKTLRQITAGKQSGFGFVVSPYGSTIAFRRTVREQNAKASRIQEAVVVDLRSLNERVLEQGGSVDIPFFTGNNIPATYRALSSDAKFNSSLPIVLGTAERGITVLKDGKSIIVDPFAGGQYIWPSLSPDKKKLTGVEMGHGAFICDLDGKNIIRLGRCNSPQWSSDGRWVIGMNDIDDGHVITGSDIIAVTADGKKKVNLTNSPGIIELFPTVHPLSNEIITTTSTGTVLLIKYVEGN
ncbi:MAG: hypothetical protein ACOYNS_06235 [Bacteroidota bacterium]